MLLVLQHILSINSTKDYFQLRVSDITAAAGILYWEELYFCTYIFFQAFYLTNLTWLK